MPHQQLLKNMIMFLPSFVLSHYHEINLNTVKSFYCDGQRLIKTTLIHFQTDNFWYVVDEKLGIISKVLRGKN